MANMFKLSISSPTESVYDSEASLITIKVYKGYIGILANHIPFVSSIRPCVFDVVIGDASKPLKGIISDGMIATSKDKVNIIANKVTWVQDIDKEEAKRKLEEIETNLKEMPKNKTLLSLKEYYGLVLNFK